jgi:hypothetical protein
LKIITFYADCVLPPKAHQKQSGFDWHKAIAWLTKSAARQGYETVVVTDTRTSMDAWLRVGDATNGLMLWILEAQAAAIAAAGESCVMVSPDSLVMGKLDGLLAADVTLLTRFKPKPIVNSVIGFQPSDRLHRLWIRMLAHAKTLPPESLEWGADIDALVSYMGIAPLEDQTRMVDDVSVRFMPMESVFTSVKGEAPNTPIWDFKGNRKRLMAQYARML